MNHKSQRDDGRDRLDREASRQREFAGQTCSGVDDWSQECAQEKQFNVCSAEKEHSDNIPNTELRRDLRSLVV